MTKLVMQMADNDYLYKLSMITSTHPISSNKLLKLVVPTNKLHKLVMLTEEASSQETKPAEIPRSSE